MISATIVVTTLAVMACMIFPLALYTMDKKHTKALASKDEYYKDLKEETKELRKRVAELREIAATHEVKPIILEPIIIKRTILDEEWFTCHPSKLIGLLEPFANSVDDVDTLELTITGLTHGKKDGWHYFTSKTSTDLMKHLDHTLCRFQACPDAGIGLIWRHEDALNFKVKLEYTKKVMPTEPQIHYVKVLVKEDTSEVAPSKATAAAAVLDKEYLEALIELAVEEKLNKSKLAGQTRKDKV